MECVSPLTSPTGLVKTDFAAVYGGAPLAVADLQTDHDWPSWSSIKLLFVSVMEN